MEFSVLRAMVKHALEMPQQHVWTLQGFGMLRTYLGPELRVHVWDSRYAVENVSLIHTHPWDFESLIVAGRLKNTRYSENEWLPWYLTNPHRFNVQTIACGTGGGLVGHSKEVYLYESSEEIYESGSTYRQIAEEIHKSSPEDGTVTAVLRAFREDTEHARVFWPVGGEWVSAEPRRATPAEIRNITAQALERWFS